MNQLILMATMVFAALLGAGGQIFLKKAATTLVLTPKGLVTNVFLLGFAILYGVAVLINIVAYKLGGKVQYLYPVISLSYIFANVFAWKFLGEQITTASLIGSIIIVIGVTVIGFGAAQ